MARVPIRTSPYWPDEIDLGKHPRQAAFLSLPHREALYGGAAGGGKSAGLLLAALQYVTEPNYSALLLRESYPELTQEGGLIDLAHKWLWGTDARWKDTEHTYVFPSGSKLAFGYLKTSTDKLRYRGGRFDYIGFDELTLFEQADYLYLFSRIRRAPGSRIPQRMRGASNPGGKGHRWVSERFLKEASPDRIFIPAKLSDNPGIDQAEYRESLANLDPETRAQLEEGDWTVREPGAWVFDHKAIDAVEELGRRFDEQLAAGKMPAPTGQSMASGTDYGDNHTVFEPIWPLERGGMYVPPGEIHTSRVDLQEITDAACDLMGNFPFWWAEARYDSSFAQSNRTFAALARNRLGQTNLVKRRGGPNTVPVHFNKDKDPTIRYLRLLMNRTLAYIEGDGDGTRVLAISPRASLLLDQLRGYKEDDFGKPLKGDDDAVDALIAGVAPVARKHRATLDERTEKAKRKAEAASKLRVQPSQVA